MVRRAFSLRQSNLFFVQKLFSNIYRICTMSIITEIKTNITRKSVRQIYVHKSVGLNYKKQKKKGNH